MEAAGEVRKWACVVPKKRARHHSYDESVDEPARLLEQEPVEIEKETPAKEAEAIERTEQDDREAPAFEE